MFNYRRAVYIIGVLLILFFISVKLYYEFYPNQLSFSPQHIALMDEHSGHQTFIDRDSRDGRDILRSMYGPYAQYILANKQIPVSTPAAAEFTLPQLKYNDVVHVLREHPSLRYYLWKQEPPDIVLLGSSMFFCDFNRETFFKRCPSARLLDFTTGNNTPYIASYLVQYADSLRLPFKPNTVFIYGMNNVEMLGNYRDRNSHEYLKSIIKGEHNDKDRTVAEKISEGLNLDKLKYDVARYLDGIYSKKVSRNVTLYKHEIPGSYLKDTATFRRYIRRNVDWNTSAGKKFDSSRIAEVGKLAALLSKYNCKFIVLKLPQSVYNDYNLGTHEIPSYFDRDVKLLSAYPNVQYEDVSAHQLTGISDLDYIWPGNIFDPEHLNYQGSDKFTRYLISNVIAPVTGKK